MWSGCGTVWTRTSPGDFRAGVLIHTGQLHLTVGDRLYPAAHVVSLGHLADRESGPAATPPEQRRKLSSCSCAGCGVGPRDGIDGVGDRLYLRAGYSCQRL